MDSDGHPCADEGPNLISHVEANKVAESADQVNGAANPVHDTTPVVTPAPAMALAPAPPVQSPKVNTWQVPDNLQGSLRKPNFALGNLQALIGRLEVDYQQRKQELLAQHALAQQAWHSSIRTVAEAGGLDMDKERWNLDYDRMVFIRVQ